jgi:acyl-CoA thioester hydrolase
MGERRAPSQRSAYKAFVELTTRWSDNDVYGHMNNVVHYALFDTAVNQWLIEQGALDIHKGEQIGLVVHTECYYFAEMAFPDRVTAGLRAERVGNSSVTYGVALFRNDEDSASAEGQFTHVYVAREGRQPQPLPPSLQAVFKGVMHS